MKAKTKRSQVETELTRQVSRSSERIKKLWVVCVDIVTSETTLRSHQVSSGTKFPPKA